MIQLAIKREHGTREYIKLHEESSLVSARGTYNTNYTIINFVAIILELSYECDPGLCVIINNMVYGSKDDKDDDDNLHVLFTTLGFTVVVHQDLTANKMRSTVEDYSHMDHNRRAFILILLSHGREGDVVYGTDGGEVEVEQLKQMFYTTKCPSLAGVPKVFLIDACRVDRREERCRSLTSSKDSSDFIIVYASTYQPRRNNTRKSCFTRTLLKVITEADKDQEFNAIVTEVTSQVQKVAQTVQSESTLMKPYYIKRSVFFDSI